jgi:hypothetical protein
MTSFQNKINKFYKLATSKEDAIKNLQYAINLEIDNGIKSINYIIKINPRAEKIQGIEAIKSTFPKLKNLNNRLVNDPDITLKNMLDLINEIEFFTNDGNAGTGYENITHTGTFRSPAAYSKRIKTYIQNLMNFLRK